MEGASMPNPKEIHGSEFYCDTVQEVDCDKIIHGIGFEKYSCFD